MNYKVIILPAILDAAVNHPRSEERELLIHFDFFPKPQNGILGQLLKDTSLLAFVLGKNNNPVSLSPLFFLFFYAISLPFLFLLKLLGI